MFEYCQIIHEKDIAISHITTVVDLLILTHRTGESPESINNDTKVTFVGFPSPLGQNFKKVDDSSYVRNCNIFHLRPVPSKILRNVEGVLFGVKKSIFESFSDQSPANFATFCFMN